MNSIYLKWLSNSPIRSTTLGFILQFLRKGEYAKSVVFRLKDWQVAHATAVYLTDGKVVNLESSLLDIQGSIFVDDSHKPPVPRSKEAFESNPMYTGDMIDQVSGIAAYKLVWEWSQEQITRNAREIDRISGNVPDYAG